MPRPVMLAGLLGAAVGVPYAVDNSESLRGMLQPGTAPVVESQPAAPAAPEMLVPRSPGDHIYTSPAPIEGVPTYSLAEVLRMDVSKEWVYSRWARKSTGLAEPGLYGVRVPLVSGTRMSDVAGSLTYYFNVQGQIDKIRLIGKTADTTELVNLLASRYGFQQKTPLLSGEQLFQVEERGQIAGQLKSRPESVLWSTSPHDSFAIELEVNRPGSGRFVKQTPAKLPAIDTPPPPAAPILGQKQPVQGSPVFPAEVLVPSSDGVKADTVSASKKPEETPAPKKLPKSPLRWPN